MSDTSERYDEAEKEATRRLIEAAPDLLEACIAALERFDIEEEIPAPRSMLRHAIQKATGVWPSVAS